jgi:hypothetical protein
MLMPVRTAIPCHEAFNNLDEWVQDDEIDDDQDERAHWQGLCDRVAHATWNSDFLSSRDREHLAAFYADYRVQIAPRVGSRPGEGSLELVTPAVGLGLLTRRDADIATSRRSTDYHGYDGVSRSVYVEVAKEGIFDWTVRAQASGFELRRCHKCAKWFTPVRANRARFCSDTCRSRFNAPLPKGSIDFSTFACAQCGLERERNEFSGLISRETYGESELDPGIDLAMSSYPYGKKPWCVPCVLDHRPQWRRYVTTVEQERVGATR